MTLFLVGDTPISTRILHTLSAAEGLREVSHLLNSCSRLLEDRYYGEGGQKAPLTGRWAHKTHRIIECQH